MPDTYKATAQHENAKTIMSANRMDDERTVEEDMEEVEEDKGDVPRRWLMVVEQEKTRLTTPWDKNGQGLYRFVTLQSHKATRR